MSVSNQTPVNTFTANGATTVFNFTFQLLKSTDLLVHINDTTKTIGADYSVSGVGNQAGGSVTFTSAPANGATVMLVRATVLERQTDYQNNGDLRAATVNSDFDRIWLAIQEIYNRTLRAVKLPFGTTDDQSITENATDRKNTVIGFDALGNLTLLDQQSGTSLVDLSGSEGASLVGYKSTSPGAVKRTTADKMSDIVSRSDFDTDGNFESARHGKVGIDGGTIYADEVVDAVLSSPKIIRARTSGYYNIEPPRLAWWSSALSRHRSGNGRARIACIGDSTTSGVGSNPSSATADSRRRAYPAALAAALTSIGNIKAQANSIWCDGYEGSNIPAFDPRITLGANWSIHPSLFCAGGRAFHDQASSPESTELIFDPGVTTDTLDVFYIKYPGYSDFIVVDGSGGTFVGAQSTTGTAGVAKATFTRTASANEWVVQKSNFTLGTDLLIVGMDAYTAADIPVSVWNMGASGSRVADWTADNQPYSFVNAIQVFAPDLSIINLTINDWSNQTPPVTYKTKLQQIIAACKFSGDVLMVIGVPSNIGNATAEIQAEYAGYVYEIAADNDLPLINLSERWVSQTYRPDRNFYYDGLHPSNAGYQDVAYAIAKIISNP